MERLACASAMDYFSDFHGYLRWTGCGLDLFFTFAQLFTFLLRIFLTPPRRRARILGSLIF